MAGHTKTKVKIDVPSSVTGLNLNTYLLVGV
jgi:hypothetical protein